MYVFIENFLKILNVLFVQVFVFLRITTTPYIREELLERNITTKLMKNREICVMRKLMTPRCEDPADVFFMAPSPGDLFHPTTSLFLKSRVGFVMNCRKAKTHLFTT